MSCSRTIADALSQATELIEFWFAYTPQQKNQQKSAIVQLEAAAAKLVRNHDAITTVWRYLYETADDATGVEQLASAIVNLTERSTSDPNAMDGMQKTKHLLFQLDQLEKNALLGVWSIPQAVWKEFPSMLFSRCNFALTALHGGGVLAAGGWDGPKRGWDEGGHVLSSVEVLRPGDAKWRAIAPLPTARHGCMGVTLADGRVMVIGGSDENLGPLRTVEAWDPKSGRWKRMTSTYGEHSNGGATLLPDGRVFVCAGYGGGRSAEIYDVQADCWTLLTSMHHPRTGGRFGCSAVSLQNGFVVVLGGKGLRSCEIIDTVDNSEDVLAAEDYAIEKEAAIQRADQAVMQAQQTWHTALDALPALKKAESQAALVAQQAIDAYADDALEKSEERSRSRQARVEAEELVERRKSEHIDAVEAAKTARLVAETARADARHLVKDWKDIAQLTHARFEAASCSIQDHIVVMGGEDSHFTMLDSAEVYHSSSNTWRPLPEARLPEPKTDLRCVLLAGGFWGGANRSSLQTVKSSQNEQPSSSIITRKAIRLATEFDQSLVTTQAQRDDAPWSTKEQQNLILLGRRYPGASTGRSDTEWKEIAKQRGTGRSPQSVAEYFKAAFPDGVSAKDMAKVDRRKKKVKRKKGRALDEIKRRQTVRSARLKNGDSQP